MLLSSQYKWEDEEKEQFSREIQQKTNHLIELIQDLNLSLQMDGEIPLLLSKQNLVEFVRRVVADVLMIPRQQPITWSFTVRKRQSKSMWMKSF